MNNSKAEIVLKLSGVHKVFWTSWARRKKAVDGVGFEIPSGQIMALIGQNGSGKSTTLKMILGFLRPTSGEILSFGYPSYEPRAREKIGYLPENPRFHRFLKAEEALRFLAGLTKMPHNQIHTRVGELLELVGLQSVAHERVRGFSKGMVQRLALAQALLNRPRLLILDEPMSGLDPHGRSQIRQILQQAHDKMPDTSILLTSHVLSDVEALCDRVIVLKKGAIVGDDLIDKWLSPTTQGFEVLARKLTGEQSSFAISNTIAGFPELIEKLKELQEAKATVIQVSSKRKALEEFVFSEDLQ